MPTVQKSSKRRATRSSGTRRARNDPQDISRLVDQVDKVLAQLAASGLLAITRAIQRSPRTPLPEYARVVAIGEAEEVSAVRGRTGIVLDIAEREAEGARTYTVYFPSRRETFVLHESSLWDTGETVPEDVIYGGGKTRRVRVDAAGNGAIVA